MSFYGVLSTVVLAAFSLSIAVSRSNAEDLTDGAPLEAIPSSIKEKLLHEEEEWFVNEGKIKIYSYDPYNHWDTQDWKRISSGPITSGALTTFRTCSHDDKTNILRAPYQFRGLAMIMEIRVDFMYEEMNGTLHELFARFESGPIISGAIDLNPTRNPNVTGKIEKEVQTNHWYQYTMYFEFVKGVKECGLTLYFTSRKSCVSVCCMSVYVRDPVPVIVPTYLGINCTIDSDNRCIPMVNYRFFWYQDHPKETVREDMAVFETNKETNATFWCRVMTGEFEHNSRKTWRSRNYFVGKTCPKNSTELNCCELDGDYCKPKEIITQSP